MLSFILTTCTAAISPLLTIFLCSSSLALPVPAMSWGSPHFSLHPSRCFFISPANSLSCSPSFHQLPPASRCLAHSRCPLSLSSALQQRSRATDRRAKSMNRICSASVLRRASSERMMYSSGSEMYCSMATATSGWSAAAAAMPATGPPEGFLLLCGVFKFDLQLAGSSVFSFFFLFHVIVIAMHGYHNSIDHYNLSIRDNNHSITITQLIHNSFKLSDAPASRERRPQHAQKARWAAAARRGAGPPGPATEYAACAQRP